jgi:hypothetical protein
MKDERGRDTEREGRWFEGIPVSPRRSSFCIFIRVHERAVKAPSKNRFGLEITKTLPYPFSSVHVSVQILAKLADNLFMRPFYPNPLPESTPRQYTASLRANAENSCKSYSSPAPRQLLFRVWRPYPGMVPFGASTHVAASLMHGHSCSGTATFASFRMENTR